MHNLSLDHTPQPVNTYSDGATVTYRNTNGQLVTATVVADRGGDRVKVKVNGLSSYIQRSTIVNEQPILHGAYVNLDDTTYRILCELVDAGTGYYIVARKYPGILASDALLDNLHFERATIADSWRLAWGGVR